MNKLIKYTIITSSLMIFSSAASAAATYCSDTSSPPNGLNLSDMTFNGESAYDCYGLASGNDNVTAVNGLTEWGTGTGDDEWTLLTKDDDPGLFPNGSGSYGVFDFQLTADAGTSGSWTLTGTDTNGSGTAPDFPAFFDFVGALKGGSGYALWFFNDAEVNANNSGTFTINFTNGGASNPDLSHLTLYIRDGEDETPELLPEPTTLLLFGIGLLGFATMRRQ